MQYEWVKYNKCVRLPDSGGRVLDCNSDILSPLSFDEPQLWRSVSLCSYPNLLTCAHCAQWSPSIPEWFASQILAPAGGRTEWPNRALRIPVSYGRQRLRLSFLLVHRTFWAWCRINSLSRTNLQSPITKLVCSNSHFGSAALSAPIMLLCCSFASASFTVKSATHVL